MRQGRSWSLRFAPDTLLSRRFLPSQAKLRSTIQVRPVILSARCRLLTIRSCHPWSCFRVRASLRLLWPASAITVLILGNNALNPPSSKRARTPIGGVSRFDTVGNQQAQCVDQDVAFTSFYALVRVETTSTTTLGRLDRLAIHDHHRWTNCPSGVTTGLLVEHAM